MYACAGQRPAPAGVGLWPGWMGTDHPAAFGGGPERLKTLGVGGGCEQCLVKADIAGSGHGACSNRKAEGQSGTTVFPATWFWVTLLVAMFRRESGDQLSQFAWDWDWAGAKSCCHPLAPASHDGGDT